jgi:predicted secreted hydrolase
VKDLGALASRAEIPDLAPVETSEIEWWFLQGWIEGEGIARTHAMASFFQMRGIDHGDHRGAMLIQHALTPGHGSSWTDSRINAETTAVHREIAAKVAAGFPGPLRRLALWRHHRDTARWMHESGMVLDTTGPEVRAAPLALSWRGFGLAQTGESLALDMALGELGALALTLTPESHWLEEVSGGLHPELSDEFAYTACPRLSAQGTLDGHPVTGRFWFDRQWGDYDGWLLARSGGGMRVLGWHWFGINLEDGRDLLLFHQTDPAARAARFSSGVVFEDGRPHAVGAFRHRALRSWTSPASGARYPVDWQIELDDLDLCLKVAPLVDDQEIPIYGTTAIWEGAVAVSGTSRGAPVRGLGRQELVGYGAPLTLPSYFARAMQRYARSMSGAIGRLRP